MRRAALSALAVTASLEISSAGMANPKGGVVNAGTATIQNTSPNQLDVVQSTNRAVIDWQSFDIAVGERTNFQQPSAASLTLNRVHAPDPSTIAGQLNANGSLVLINPNGVVFSRGSQVNVNSIIATPTDITNANFMAGNMRFDRPSPNPNAQVINQGSITVAQKGLAALVAPGVANSGVIQANLGRVVLAGAETFTVDFYGDGLINFDVGAKVGSVPLGADGKPLTSLVSNTGTIDAAGGTVLLTADAVSGILANVVDGSGQINAPTVATGRGSVTLDAGAGNAARLAGTIDVSADAAGQSGGTAVVTGGSASLASTARIDARGPAGGGTVKIGGGPHGTDNGVRNAQSTTIASGAMIDASATDNGTGGTVAVWSDGSSVFNGAIYARGGPNGGDGGWVETSGHTLAIGNGAIVDASPRSSLSKPGQWLLDPIDLTVDTSEVNINNTAGNPTTITPVASPATVANTTIENALNANNNVVLTTIGTSGAETGAITVNAPIQWTTPSSLTLNAAGAIVINATVTGTDPGSLLALNAAATVSQSAAGTIAVGTLTGTSTGGATLTAGNSIDTLGSFINNGPTGSIAFNNTKSLAVTGPISGGPGLAPDATVHLSVTGAGSTLTIAGPIDANSDPFSAGYSVSLTATGAITETPTGSIRAGSLRALTQNDAGAAITLDNTANAVPGSVTLTALNTNGTFFTPGAITFFDSTGFLINNAIPGVGGLELGISTAANAILQAGGTISQNGSNSVIIAQNLVARTLNDAGAAIQLDADNSVSGTLTLSALNAAGTARAPGAITFFENSGFVIDSVAGGGVGGLELGIATTATATLQAGGTISQNAPAGTINAQNLVVRVLSSEPPDNIVLAANNVVPGNVTLSVLDGSGAMLVPGSITFVDSTGFTVASLVGAETGIGVVGQVSVFSGGSISEATGAAVTATTLTGSAAGSVALTQVNQVDALSDFATTTGGANGDFTLRNGKDLTVSGTVNTGTGTLTLDTGPSSLTVAPPPISVGPNPLLLTTGTINLIADQLAINNQVGGSALNAGTATQVNIAPSTTGQPIALAPLSEPLGALSLTSAELNNIRGATVNIGNGAAGPLTFDAFTASANFATTLLSLTSGSTATFTGALSLSGGLSVTAAGGITLSGGAVNTATTQSYNNPVMLTANTVLTSSGAGALGNIGFAGTLDGPFALTANTAGVTAFNGAVGGGAALASLTTDAPGTTDLNGGLVNTSGPQTYGDPVVLTANTTLASSGAGALGNIGFAGTVDGPFALTVNTAGATAFNGAVGGTAALASLATDAPGTTDLNGSFVNTTGTQIYGDPVVLTANTILASSGAGAVGNITFASTIDGPFALTANTAGVTAFNGGVGGGAALASLTTDAPGTTDLNGGLVNTAGPQTYGDPVVLTANTVLASSGAGALGNIGFAGTVDGPFALTVNTAGATAFNGAVGGTAALANLATDAAGTTDLNGGLVNTTGTQTYTDAVVLTADTVLASSGTGAAGNITFASTVDGSFALSVNTAGMTAFNGGVGGTAALASLATDAAGTTDLNGGLVNTAGPQTYGDPVVLTANTVLASSGAGAAGNIGYAGTVDGPFALTVNTAGLTGFNGAVGGTAALASLATDAPGTTDLNGGVVNTTGTQTYGDPVVLMANTILASSGAGAAGNITFASTVDGPFGLSVNTAGVTAFNGGVGGTAALTSLATDAAGTTDLHGALINTSGTQTYNDPLVLTADTVLASAGNITFAGTVDGPFALSVNTAGVTAFNGGVGGTAALAALDATSAGIAANAAITTTGALTLNATESGLSLGWNLIGSTVTLRAAGPIAQTGGTIAAGLLTGNSSGGATLLGGNQIATLGTFTNAGSGPLTLVNNRSLTTTGQLSSAGDINITLGSGALTMASDVTAITGDVLFSVQTGALSLTGPITVSAGRDVSITAAGAIDILGPIAGGSLSLAAGRNILMTSGFGPQNSGGVTLAGTIAMEAGDPTVVIASDGAFTQSGTFSINSAEYVIVDTTGVTAEQRLSELNQAVAATSVQNSPNPIVITNPAFNPQGLTANDIRFDGTIDAARSVLLLIADRGRITGGSNGFQAVNVDGLGVSGTGGEAALFGSIAGNFTAAAAAAGRINPAPQEQYRFNNCIIGSAFCVLPLSDVDILLALPTIAIEAFLRPQAAASEIDILVARPAPDEIDAPLVNVFDEERLCELMLRRNPALGREVCR